MRIIASCLLLLFPLFFLAQTTGLVIEGTYKGKNLYVQNPFSEDGKGFCTIEVKVNGKTTGDSVNSSAYEINLSVYGFKLGDPIKIEILHKNNCTPKILHPEHSYPDPAFNLISIELDNTGKLQWSTTKEADKTSFIIEQFRWNKWVMVGEMEGQGPGGLNMYEFQLTLHSGKNTVRVKKLNYRGIHNVSKPASVESTMKPIQLASSTFTDKLVMSAPTLYQVFDKGGNLVKKGFGAEIDFTSLPKDHYFVNYDNNTAEVQKK